MSSTQKRLLALVGGLFIYLLVAAFLYSEGMERLEGKQRSYWRSLEFATETLTTTGYGQDSQWRHPAMIVFVMFLQWTGVFIVFLIFPIYLIPFLEERFESRLPEKIPPIDDHVVVFRYGPAVEGLLDELRAAGVKTVVVELDATVARHLVSHGEMVVFAEDEDAGLAASHLDKARALIANGNDEENASIILGARQAGFEGEIAALVEEPVYRQPISLAGASSVYTPRHVLAVALAARASRKISPRLSGIRQLGDKIEVRELRIQPGSDLANKTLGESQIGAKTGAVVIGQWAEGQLMTAPTADMKLQSRGILVVAGGSDSIGRLSDLVEGATPLRREGAYLVAGFGEVGQKVHELLTDAGEEVRVVNMEPHDGVDVVGNVLDPAVLAEAGVATAQAVILALDSDDATLFATVIVKDCAPQASILARVNRSHNLEKIRRAGVDFALSISQVSGQILAQRLLGQASISVDPKLRLTRVSCKGLAGNHPADLRVRERTGCSVVAVERGDEVQFDFGPTFRFETGDQVYVSGSEEAIRVFRETYHVS